MKFANALRPSRTKWTRLRSVEWKRRRGEGRRRVENAPRYYLQSSYKLPSQVVIDGRRNEERTNERRRKNVAEGGRKDEVKLILLHFSGTFFSVALPFSVWNVSVAPSGRVRFRQTKKKRKLETFSRIPRARPVVLRNHYALFDGASVVVGL